MVINDDGVFSTYRDVGLVNEVFSTQRLKDLVEGKRVVLIDDSIVRGNTCRRTIELLRRAGAREIHMRVSAPPFVNACFYGTDIDDEEKLIANHHSV